MALHTLEMFMCSFSFNASLLLFGLCLCGCQEFNGVTANASHLSHCLSILIWIQFIIYLCVLISWCLIHVCIYWRKMFTHTFLGYALGGCQFNIYSMIHYLNMQLIKSWLFSHKYQKNKCSYHQCSSSLKSHFMFCSCESCEMLWLFKHYKYFFHCIVIE